MIIILDIVIIVFVSYKAFVGNVLCSIISDGKFIVGSVINNVSVGVVFIFVSIIVCIIGIFVVVGMINKYFVIVIVIIYIRLLLIVLLVWGNN